METREDKSIVVEGRNVEEALQAACDMLDTTPNQVDYEVCESGRSGMLGFLKGKTYKIRVWKKSEAERMIRQLLAGLFDRLGFDVQFKITRADDAYEIDIETEGADGLLIGRGGETLTGLQHLISRMVGHLDDGVRVRVDVAGYRRRRHDQLRRKARDLAERALTSGRDVVTEPLPADERRIIHLALAEDGRVQTRALGDGAVKRVTIVPQSRGRGGEEPRGRGAAGRSGRSRGAESRGSRSSSRPRPGGRSGASRSTGRDGSSGGRPGESDDRPDRGPRGGRRGPPRREREVVPVAGGDESGPDQIEDHLVGEREGRPAQARGTARRRPRSAEPTPSASEEHTEDRGAQEPPEDQRAEKEPRTRLWDVPDDSDAYFKVPESLGAGASGEAESSSDEASGDGEATKPISYGRRPQGGRRRRR